MKRGQDSYSIKALKIIALALEQQRRLGYEPATIEEAFGVIERAAQDHLRSSSWKHQRVKTGQFAPLLGTAVQRGSDWMNARSMKWEATRLELREHLGLRRKSMSTTLARTVWHLVVDPRLQTPSRRFIRAAGRLLRGRPGAALRIWNDATTVAHDLGCTEEEAALWLLCGEPLPSSPLRAELDYRDGAAELVRMEVNPHLVDSDEVRSAYRQLRKELVGDVSARLWRFDQLELLGNGLGLREQMRTWNELYPLDRYQNENTFRVAMSRARGAHRSGKETSRGKARKR